RRLRYSVPQMGQWQQQMASRHARSPPLSLTLEMPRARVQAIPPTGTKCWSPFYWQCALAR
ncbi:MAG: hypothetical protein R3300_11145, partial [Candidatus Promineifilaceae bacterium]|nr:hypothetical protein [Candidatus Promineifilaceae bacterium]